jgi:hypothetical protein
MVKDKVKILPTGIELLRYFYALTAIFSSFYLFLFLKYTRIIWCGSVLSQQKSVYATLVLIITPLLLYFGFKYQNLFIWYLAFLYHIFFTLNSFLGAIFSLWNYFPFRPMIRITGKELTELPLASDTALRLFTVFNLNLFLGIIILWYLWRERCYFRERPR